MVERRLRLALDVGAEDLHLVPFLAHVVNVLPEANGNAVGLRRHVVGDDEDAQVGLALVAGGGLHETRHRAARHRHADHQEGDAAARHE